MRDEKKTPLFESGSAVMTDAVRLRLNDLVQDLIGKKNIMIAITGHTDNQRISSRLQSKFSDNQALSEARAFVVAAYLRGALKLEVTQFAVGGKGEGNPIADNTTDEGRAANRRVEIQVWFDELKETPKGIEAQPLCGSSELSPLAQFSDRRRRSHAARENPYRSRSTALRRCCT